ncbi:MAG: hypothetical protein EA380_07870 [Phycisphaeraceae bacterium]|nr:MAG: hypothetical protein EA380_07870 [Phycisphaeraceae bacterium]
MKSGMARILHIVDAGEIGACACVAIRSLIDSGEGEHFLLMVGTGAELDRARRLGLTPDATIPMRGVRIPRGHAIDACDAKAFEIVHAWSSGAGVIGGKIAGETPRVVSLGWMPGHADARRLAGVARRGGIRAVTTPDEATALLCREAGFGAVRTVAWPVDPPRLAGRASLRRRIGIHPEEKVFLAIGEPTSEIDAKVVAYQAGVASVVGQRMVALVPEGARDLDRAVRFTLYHDEAWRVVVVPLEPLEMLACADLVLLQPRGSGGGEGIPLRPVTSHSIVSWAVAAGVPVVGEDCAEVRSIVGNGRIEFAEDASPLALNRVIYRMLSFVDQTDPNAVGVTPVQTPERYVEAIRSVYRSVITSGSDLIHA